MDGLEVGVTVRSFAVQGLHIVDSQNNGVPDTKSAQYIARKGEDLLGLSFEGFHYSLQVQWRLCYTYYPLGEGGLYHFIERRPLGHNRFFEDKVFFKFNFSKRLFVDGQHALDGLERVPGLQIRLRAYVVSIARR